MAGTERHGAVPGCGAAPRGCLAGPARGAALEALHAMSPPEWGRVEGSSSSLGVPPPPRARSLTMLDSTLRHCHGNRSFRLCWRCLHQRPQQGRIQPENASPTQASITPRKRRAPAEGGRGSGPPCPCCSQGPAEGTRLWSLHPVLEERLSSSVGSGHRQQAATGSDGQLLTSCRAGGPRRSGERHRQWSQH